MNTGGMIRHVVCAAWVAMAGFMTVTPAMALTWDLVQGGSVPDGGSQGFSFNVSGEGNHLDLVEIRVAVRHLYDSDLSMWLIAPNSTRVDLVTRRGSSGDNFQDTLFSDSGSLLISAGSAPFNGIYKPEGTTGNTLSKFLGIDPNGVWTLYLSDSVPGYTGYVYGDTNTGAPTQTPWSNLIGTQLILTTHNDNPVPPTAGVPEPMTAGLSLLAIAGLGLTVSRRRSSCG